MGELAKDVICYNIDMGKKYKTRKDYTKNCNICSVELNENNNCKSHILPRFIFENVKESKNEKLVSLSDKYKQPKKTITIGFYEKDLLCRDCENKKLSAIESRVCKLTRPSNSPNIITTKSGQTLEYDKCNYDDLLLFGLGVIFKASISKKYKINNSLSKRNLNIIRKILNGEINIPYKNYSVMVGKYTSGEFCGEIVSMPTCSVKKDDLTGQMWQIQLGNGFYMYVFVNIKKQEANIYRDIVTKSGRFTASDLGNFDESKEFKEFVIPLVQESMRKEQNIV